MVMVITSFLSRLLSSVDHDYLSLIAYESNGLTSVGRKLFQESIESYVYSVLGAQAKTRWSIVNMGAKSSQTQDVFHQLVNDTIVQSDPTVTITNMRTAIRDTNVVLNMAITPGVILVPSSMIILKDPIAGYNNILTLAKKGMTFGKNDDVNYNKVVVKEVVKEVKQDVKQEVKQDVIKQDVSKNVVKKETTVPKGVAKQVTEEVVSGVAGEGFKKVLLASSISPTIRIISLHLHSHKWCIILLVRILSRS